MAQDRAWSLATGHHLQEGVLRRQRYGPWVRLGREGVEQLRLPRTHLMATLPSHDLQIPREWPKAIRGDHAGHDKLAVPLDAKPQGWGITGDKPDLERAAFDG